MHLRCLISRAQVIHCVCIYILLGGLDLIDVDFESVLFAISIREKSPVIFIIRFVYLVVTRELALY
jgi:hypothetical protein